MITSSIAFGIVALILGITFGLVKIIYDIIISRVKSVEIKSQNLHDRVKDLEAFNTHKIDQLIKDFSEFKTIVSNKLHRDADFINTTKNAISRIEPILIHFENWQDEHEEMKLTIKQLTKQL
jgi:esterase/lipase